MCQQKKGVIHALVVWLRRFHPIRSFVNFELPIQLVRRFKHPIHIKKLAKIAHVLTSNTSQISEQKSPPVLFIKKKKPRAKRAPQAQLYQIIARAKRWANMLEKKQYPSIRQLARAEKVTPARVCQCLRILKLPPNILQHALEWNWTERKLRKINENFKIDEH